MVRSLFCCYSIIDIALEAASDEIFDLFAYFVSSRMRQGKGKSKCLTNYIFPHKFRRLYPFSEGLSAVEQLIKDDTYGPDIHLIIDLRLFLQKDFRRKVVACSDVWRSQLNTRIRFIHYLTYSEVNDFDFSKMKEDIRRFEIVVNHCFVLLMEIFYCLKDLLDDLFSLFLLQILFLSQIGLQFRS